jgi:dihydropyrimidinase
MSTPFDTLIRDAEIVTAADRYRADIGITGGAIVAIGRDLPAGRETIDADGRLDACDFVALTATNAAKLYGLFPRKGTLAVGSDADLVIWDTGTPRTIRNAALHHAVDYTPYEGLEVRAWPAITMSRGSVVWRDGQYLGRAGHGRFLKCERPTPAKTRGRGHRSPVWTP